jgi:hypothetical protein
MNFKAVKRIEVIKTQAELRDAFMAWRESLGKYNNSKKLELIKIITFGYGEKDEIEIVSCKITSIEDKHTHEIIYLDGRKRLYNNLLNY